uniref:Uncharacterized protein n=1 Tax=Culex tarsalis TaxID=7177 RepID=A0A1Q3F7Q3_CULTA
MSSPGERRNPFESPENKDGPPLYNSTENFLPLGFSTPQHRNSNSAGSQMYSRTFYSTQPKYMLPRQRGFQNRNRGHQQQQQQQNYGGSPSSPGGDDGQGGSGPPERRNWNQNRNWKGGFRHNNQQQNQHGQFQRRNRFGLGHQQSKGNESYNIADYFHPSMLEDPWMQLVQNSEQAKGDSSDNGEGPAGGGSSGLDED